MNINGNENDWAILFGVLLLICLLIGIRCFCYVIKRNKNKFYVLYVSVSLVFNLFILFGVWIRSVAVSNDFNEYMNGDSYEDLDSSNKFLFIMVYLCLILLTILIIFALIMIKRLKNKDKGESRV